MSFDLNALAIQEQGITPLQLKHPATGDLLFADDAGTQPVTITISSTSSRAYRQAVAAMRNRALKRGKKIATAAEQEEEGIELLVACCITSDNLPYNGEAVKTESQFRALLSDVKMSWIRNQVDEYLGDVENFIAK